MLRTESVADSGRITGYKRGWLTRDPPLGKNATMLTTILCTALIAGQATASPYVDPNLKGLMPFIGKTWKGTFEVQKGEKPTTDIVQFERILNGKAIRIVHSVNEGQYGGESIVFWDETKKAVRYYYFTTANFYTEGTLTIEKDKYVGQEDVLGDINGISKVRSTSEILPNGHMKVVAEYFAKGTWSVGRRADYVVSPDSKPKFN